MAVISMLFGALAIPTVLVEPTLAVLFGIAADTLGLVVLRREPDGWGRAAAIAGAVLGTFALVAVAVVVVFLGGTKTGSGSSVATP